MYYIYLSLIILSSISFSNYNYGYLSALKFFSVPVPVFRYSSYSSANVGFGLSSSFAFLMWAIWGGFILHMLLSNYLAVLMKPTYEKPIDTVGDALGEHRLDFLLNPSVKGCQFHRNFDEKHFSFRFRKRYCLCSWRTIYPATTGNCFRHKIEGNF